MKTGRAALLLPALWLLCACAAHPSPAAPTAAPDLPAWDAAESVSAAVIETGEPEEDSLPAPALPAFSAKDAKLLCSFWNGTFGQLWLYRQADVFWFVNEYGSAVRSVSAAPAKEVGQDGAIAEDLNFDGAIDFRLPSAEEEDCCACWLWNEAAHQFEYNDALSSIPSPELLPEFRLIRSVKNVSSQYVIETFYSWNGTSLTPVSHRETAPVAPRRQSGAQQIDPQTAVMDGANEVVILLTTAEDENCRWTCRVEDVNIAALTSDVLDKDAGVMLFSFRGVSPGATTVLFRYATVDSGDYLTEKVYNLIVDEEKIVTVVEVA